MLAETTADLARQASIVIANEVEFGALCHTSGASLDWLESGRRFDVRRTPSMMGMVSESFRRREGVQRSLHPTHPVLVHGPEAARFIAAHPDCLHPCGPGTPFDELQKADGLVVFLNVGIDTGRPEMVRAVLEGAAYAIAQNLEYAELLSGHIQEIRATGGPTRSALWCQIIADVCNRPLNVLADEGGAPLGNALLAGSAVGLISDLAATATAAANVRTRYVPDAARHERYGRLFAIYKQLYPNLKDLYVELARA